jgi:hypothetical protein
VGDQPDKAHWIMNCKQIRNMKFGLVAALLVLGISGCVKENDTPVVVAPVPPTGLVATPGGGKQVNLKWTDASGNESGFLIERRSAGGVFNSLTSVGPNMSSYVDEAVSANVVYSYQVYAFNGAGRSAVGAVSGDIKVSALELGMMYGGGRIGYIFQEGDAGYVAGQEHGLIVAKEDMVVKMPWGCIDRKLGVTDVIIGAGRGNTVISSMACGSYTAAGNCADLLQSGYDDWFLPSLNELRKIFVNQQQIMGFTPAKYWSSSENDRDHSFAVDFSDTYGAYMPVRKDSVLRIRAVRAF